MEEQNYKNVSILLQLFFRFWKEGNRYSSHQHQLFGKSGCDRNFIYFEIKSF